MTNTTKIIIVAGTVLLTMLVGIQACRSISRLSVQHETQVNSLINEALNH